MPSNHVLTCVVAEEDEVTFMLAVQRHQLVHEELLPYGGTLKLCVPPPYATLIVAMDYCGIGALCDRQEADEVLPAPTRSNAASISRVHLASGCGDLHSGKRLSLFISFE